MQFVKQSWDQLFHLKSGNTSTRKQVWKELLQTQTK